MEQTLNDSERSSLIPPRRLGSLLSEARSAEGLTLEEIAERADGYFSLSTLSSIERGSQFVSDDDAKRLTSVYGLESTDLVPARSKLIVDLSEGLIAVGENRVPIGRAEPSRDEVLVRYLAMVYSMRGADADAEVPLRVDDLDVLGRALRVGSREIEADLTALMSARPDSVGHRSERLRHMVLIPAAGIMVAMLSVGALVLVSASNDNSAGAAGLDSGSRDRVATVEAAPGAVVADIGTAAIQTRNADGTPGLVTVRNG